MTAEKREKEINLKIKATLQMNTEHGSNFVVVRATANGKEGVYITKKNLLSETSGVEKKYWDETSASWKKVEKNNTIEANDPTIGKNKVEFKSNYGEEFLLSNQYADISLEASEQINIPLGNTDIFISLTGASPAEGFTISKNKGNKIEILSVEKKGEIWYLNGEPIGNGIVNIGQDPSLNNISVESSTIAIGPHVTLKFNDNGVSVIDNQTIEGTIVSKKKVDIETNSNIMNNEVDIKSFETAKLAGKLNLPESEIISFINKLSSGTNALDQASILKTFETIQEYPVLIQHSELILNFFPNGIGKEAIVGNGFFGVTIEIPGSKRIVKIDMGGSDNTEESIKQQVFYKGLDLLKQDGKISKNVFIPEIEVNIFDGKKYFLMEKIEGAKTLWRAEMEFELKEKGIDFSKFSGLNDQKFAKQYQLKLSTSVQALRDGKFLPKSRHKLSPGDIGFEAMRKDRGVNNVKDLVEAVKALESNGLKNRDRSNPANIMFKQDNSGNIQWYLIDYGEAKVEENIFTKDIQKNII